jgi:hypothetical protein
VKANEILVEAVVHTENISSVDRKRKLSDSNETEKLVVENREVAGDDIECITSVDELVNEKERKNKEKKKARKASCMSKTNESSISISSPVVVSPSTVLFPILPFFITFKGDFSFITISCGSGDFSISPPVVIMLSPLKVLSSSSELSKEISFILK